MFKYLDFFQPAPTGPQMAPDGHYLQTGPTVEGPWLLQPAAILEALNTSPCAVHAMGPGGVSRYPEVDFEDGTCFRVEAEVPDTDTHGRVVAYAIITEPTGELGIVEVPSNVIPLPEPDAAWSALLLFALACLFFWGTNRPFGGSK